MNNESGEQTPDHEDELLASSSWGTITPVDETPELDNPTDDEIIVNSDLVPEEPKTDEHSDDLVAEAPASEEEETLLSNEVSFGEDTIDLRRGEQIDKLRGLLKDVEDTQGANILDARVREVGSWENLIYRAITQNSLEENRIQAAITSLKESDGDLPTHTLRDENGKVLLKDANIGHRVVPGEVQTLTGDAAMIAFACMEKGGGHRIHCYNSMITIDVIMPTGLAIETLLTNCRVVDQDLGTTNGAHYFAYADLIYKTLIVDFITPLIVDSSFINWRKKDQLFSVLKLPDLAHILMQIASLWYQKGYDKFIVGCTRPKDEEHPNGCNYTEEITADLSKMIVNRFSIMNKSSIEFMMAARAGNVKHTLAQISKQQASLGFEGEQITIDNVTLTMKIPSISEYLEAGSKYLADIVNEIAADNTNGQYEQLGLRYIRSFLPWIASIEKKLPNGGGVKTSDANVIVRELEILEGNHRQSGDVIKKLIDYVNKIQITYVGYPVTDCPQCKYQTETPSGLWTFDPFSTFFTLAFRYLKLQR